MRHNIEGVKKMIYFRELSPEYEKQIKKLYRQSFPRCERKPFSLLYKMRDEGAGELLTAFDSETDYPVGLAFMLTDGKTMLLDYLAVEPSLRSKGYGGMILAVLKKKYEGKTIIIEIEKPTPDGGAVSAEARRKAFYLRNGFCDTGTEIRLFGVDMQLLCSGGEISYEMYYGMLRSAFGEKREKLLRKNVRRIN